MNDSNQSHIPGMVHPGEFLHRAPDRPKRTHKRHSISRLTHGFLEYGLSVFLGASPWIFGFARHHQLDAEIAVTMAAVLALSTLFANFELGVVRLFPFPVHKGFDFLWGIILAGGAFYFGSCAASSIIFFAVGIAEIALAMFTRRPASLKVPTVM